MARDIGPKCKKCRRAKEKLFLRGSKCMSDKCVLLRRGEESGARSRRRVSPYSIQLREKQKLRMMYGILETQFRNYFEKAAKSRNTAATLLINLERRLDNVVYRLGFATSRAQARQMVRHGHIAVSGRRVDIPSYPVKAGQTVTAADEAGRRAVAAALASSEPATVPWLALDAAKATGTVLRLPTAEDVKDVPCNTQMIVELYSK